VAPATFRKALRSGAARPELTFQWEQFADISRELPPLFHRHWRALALDQDFVPLDPDWDSYFQLALRGVLHVLTARAVVPAGMADTCGSVVPATHRATARPPLVGYVFNLIGGHQHYASTRFAHTEMFWLDPAYRKGWQPVRMLLENIAGLKARGVEVAVVNIKLHFKDARVGRLLARLGYTATDIVMRKVL